MPHEIDSTNPELLAAWIVEIFGRIPQITPATIIELQVSPSYAWNATDGTWRPDWVADSRVIGQLRRIASPRDLVDELGKQIAEQEALRANDS
jgi:hypothetical protein